MTEMCYECGEPFRPNYCGACGTCLRREIQRLRGFIQRLDYDKILCSECGSTWLDDGLNTQCYACLASELKKEIARLKEVCRTGADVLATAVRAGVDLPEFDPENHVIVQMLRDAGKVAEGEETL